MGSVISGDDRIYHFPAKSKFFLEISHNMNQNLSDSIFTYLPQFKKPWDLNELDVYLIPNC